MRKKIFTILFLVLILLPAFSNSGNKKQEDSKIPLVKNSIQQEVTSLNSQDSLLLKRIFDQADKLNLGDSSIADVIVFVGRFFENSPYVANTLEQEGEESLVINLSEFDCTTFVENVLAIANCIKAEELQSVCFQNHLRGIRYRNGVIENYLSRLHYFSEWLAKNQEKGYLKIMSNDFGDMVFDSKVDFMSSHAEKYRQLSGNPAFVEELKEIENGISKYELKCVSESKIGEKENLINNGDIIAFCSTIEGLDIAHVALAYRKNNELHFIHASTSNGQVVISEKSLAEYVRGRKNVYGILVARPVIKN